MNFLIRHLCFAVLLFLLACGDRHEGQEESLSQEFRPPLVKIVQADTSDLEHRLIEAGLVDVQQLAPSILVDLKYASEDNFLGENVYGDLRTCYVLPEVAEMLVEVQACLEAECACSLLMFDGVRPLSVQWKMWELVKGTEQQNYVSYPSSHSMHNYGAAVDVTVVDSLGHPLDMGTEFDYFGVEAQPRHESWLLQQQKLSPQQIQNRQLLRKCMKRAGFRVLLSEWWHFNAFSRGHTKARYQIIE